MIRSWSARFDVSVVLVGSVVAVSRADVQRCFGDDRTLCRAVGLEMKPEPFLAAAAIAARSDRVIDGLPRAVVVTDLDGLILGWNRQAEAVYGWERASVLGRSVFDVVVPTIGAGLADLARDWVITGKAWTGDLTVVRRDGDTRRLVAFLDSLCDDDGKVVGMVVAAEDITDTRLLEQRASDLTDHLVLALAAGRLGTWRLDRATGATTWDATMERLFGFEPGGFDGTFDTWVSLLHPDDRQNVLDSLEAAVATKSSYDVHHRVVWPDGSIHWIYGRGQITLDADGNVTGSIGCSGDDTVRRQEELRVAERAATAERTAAAERLERRRLEFLVALNEAALSATDHRDLMRRVAAAAVPHLGDWCAVHFLMAGAKEPVSELAHRDPNRAAWARRLHEQFPFDPDARIGVAAVMRTGITEFIDHLDRQAVIAARNGMNRVDPDKVNAVLDELKITSIITVPLRVRHGIVGAMQFVSAESGLSYDSTAVSLAEAAAGRVAEALYNSWLSDQRRSISTELQSALLPSTLPAIPGLSIAARYQAGGIEMEVGGDFYDVFSLDEHRWALVIGDVCGRGASAAVITAKARYTIRAAATHRVGHGETLAWLNDAINTGNRGLFCTALYSTLEKAPDGSWTFTSVAGGHPLPVLHRRDGTTELIGTPGTLLGMLPIINVTETRTTLWPGDTVVLYTDGVTDLPAPYALDDQQLLELVGDAAKGSIGAEAVTRSIMQSVESVLPIAQRADDIAILVIQVAAP